MLKRRVPRVLATGLLLVLTVAGLSGCRTSPNVAAYIGQSQITVAELESAVDQRMADDGVAAYAKGHEDEFTRRTLALLVTEQVYADAAAKYGVQVGDQAVRDRIAQLLGNDDPTQVYAQLAQQGIGREDVFENVRQQLLRQRIAAALGKADALDVAALRARYAEVRESLKQISYGYIVVPDQATADKVLAQLTADPASYPTVAAAHANQNTLPQLTKGTADQLPGILAQGISAAAPNTGFTTDVPEIGGVVVTFVAGPVYPSFEETRTDLETEAGGTVDKAGSAIITDFRKHLGVRLNPRYAPETKDDVVDILKDDVAKTPAAAPAGPAPGN